MIECRYIVYQFNSSFPQSRTYRSLSMLTRRQREKWQTQVNRTRIRNLRNEGKLKTEN